MSTHNPHRNIYLPLETLDSCSVCSKKDNLRLCSACGEVAYCSGECQKASWDKGHKEACGNTDRIDIASFYPILALLADVCHVHAYKDMHPALLRQVMGQPKLVGFPDDTGATLVSLGPEIPRPTSCESPDWWPTAPGETARRKLFTRIVREGDVLPIAAALCIGLLSTMYTTTSSRATKQSQRRVRLQYKSSPIADFGIAKGSVNVKEQDLLAYFDGEKLWKGQDPNDHYWVYFRTVRGENIILDPSLYTFNMTIMVSSTPYTTGLQPDILPEHCMPNFAPGFLFGREVNQNILGLHTERQRVSVLRNAMLHCAVSHMDLKAPFPFTPTGVDIMWAFIEGFASPNTPLPKLWNMVPSFVYRTSLGIEDVLKRRAWVDWPAEALLSSDRDDDEKDMDYGDEEWVKSMRKWTKKCKAGEISREEYETMVRARARRIPAGSMDKTD